MSQAQEDLLGDAPDSNPRTYADSIPPMPAALPNLHESFHTDDKASFLQAMTDHQDLAYHWMLAAAERNIKLQARAEALKIRSDQQNAELQDLRLAQLEHNGTLQNLNTALASLETQRNSLEIQRDSLRNRNHTLEASASLGLAPAHRADSKKHPDPDKFDGTPSKLMEFLGQLNIKLAANRDWFPTEHDKVIYACGRLSGKASDVIMPNPEMDNLQTIPNMHAFTSALQSAFGDPDKQTTARNQLEACKQKNRPFHEFVTEFRSYAHWTGFPDEVVRYRLLQNCSTELRATFIYNLPPNGLNEAYNYLQEVWNRMTIYQPSSTAQSRKTTSTTPSLFATRNTGPSTGSSTTVTTQASTPAGTTTLTTSQGGNAMDLSAIRTNLDESGKLKESVKQHRRNNNLCLYCGNHPSTQTCPSASRLVQRDQQRGRQPNRVNTAATTVEEVAENA